MAFDYKKEYKEFYLPAYLPTIVEVPSMNFIAVKGIGDPNDLNGEYNRAMELLYAVAYTIKMSHKSNYKIQGFFEYVVPPLEGLWWQDGTVGMDYSKKNELSWISLIRLPDFVTKEDFEWSIKEATNKKKKDFSKVEFLTINEGLCVQCMHIGSYDDEEKTVKLMDEYADENGYEIDIKANRRHHEIYLSDPRKCALSELKTVIRHPIRKK